MLGRGRDIPNAREKRRVLKCFKGAGALNIDYRGKTIMRFENRVKTIMSLMWLACFTVYLSLMAGAMSNGVAAKARPLLVEQAAYGFLQVGFGR